MDVKDHVHAEYRLSTVDDTPVSYAGWDNMNRKIEVSKQIAADLQLARKRCDTMIKPIRTSDKPLEHRLLYPIGLTESRFKIQPRTKSKTPVNSSLRAYRQMTELPNLEMLSHSKVMQSRLVPSKISLAPTVYPFGDNSMSFGEKSPFQPLPVIMPLSAVLSASHHAPKHVRQGVPSHRVEKTTTAEPYCIKIPL